MDASVQLATMRTIHRCVFKLDIDAYINTLSILVQAVTLSLIQSMSLPGFRTLPISSIRPLVRCYAGFMHFNAAMRGERGPSTTMIHEPVAFVRIRRDIISPLGVDGTRVNKMLVQMVDKLKDVPINAS